MTTAYPPRWAERLLEATGADPELRDAVLGDLMEEFHIRAEYDGPDAARRWYVGEMLRTLPHLLRHWASGLTRADAKRLARTAVGAYLAVVPFGVLAVVLFAGTLEAFHVQLGATLSPHNRLLCDVGLPGLGFLDVAVGMVGGCIAARLGRATPLASALALGCLLCLLSTAGAFAWGPVQPPLWWKLATPLLNLGGTALGGILRACTVDDERVRPAG